MALFACHSRVDIPRDLTHYNTKELENKFSELACSTSHEASKTLAQNLLNQCSIKNIKSLTNLGYYALLNPDLSVLIKTNIVQMYVIMAKVREYNSFLVYRSGILKLLYKYGLVLKTERRYCFKKTVPKADYLMFSKYVVHTIEELSNTNSYGTLCTDGVPRGVRRLSEAAKVIKSNLFKKGIRFTISSWSMPYHRNGSLNTLGGNEDMVSIKSFSERCADLQLKLDELEIEIEGLGIFSDSVRVNADNGVDESVISNFISTLSLFEFKAQNLAEESVETEDLSNYDELINMLDYIKHLMNRLKSKLCSTMDSNFNEAGINGVTSNVVSQEVQTSSVEQPTRFAGDYVSDDYTYDPNDFDDYTVNHSDYNTDVQGDSQTNSTNTTDYTQMTNDYPISYPANNFYPTLHVNNYQEVFTSGDHSNYSMDNDNLINVDNSADHVNLNHLNEPKAEIQLNEYTLNQNEPLQNQEQFGSMDQSEHMEGIRSSAQVLEDESVIIKDQQEFKSNDEIVDSLLNRGSSVSVDEFGQASTGLNIQLGSQDSLFIRSTKESPLMSRSSTISVSQKDKVSGFSKLDVKKASSKDSELNKSIFDKDDDVSVTSECELLEPTEGLNDDSKEILSSNDSVDVTVEKDFEDNLFRSKEPSTQSSWDPFGHGSELSEKEIGGSRRSSLGTNTDPVKLRLKSTSTFYVNNEEKGDFESKESLNDVARKVDDLSSTEVIMATSLNDVKSSSQKLSISEDSLSDQADNLDFKRASTNVSDNFLDKSSDKVDQKEESIDLVEEDADGPDLSTDMTYVMDTLKRINTYLDSKPPKFVANSKSYQNIQSSSISSYKSFVDGLNKDILIKRLDDKKILDVDDEQLMKLNLQKEQALFREKVIVGGGKEVHIRKPKSVSSVFSREDEAVRERDELFDNFDENLNLRLSNVHLPNKKSNIKVSASVLPFDNTLLTSTLTSSGSVGHQSDSTVNYSTHQSAQSAMRSTGSGLVPQKTSISTSSDYPPIEAGLSESNESTPINNVLTYTLSNYPATSHRVSSYNYDNPTNGYYYCSSGNLDEVTVNEASGKDEKGIHNTDINSSKLIFKKGIPSDKFKSRFLSRSLDSALDFNVNSEHVLEADDNLKQLKKLTKLLLLNSEFDLDENKNGFERKRDFKRTDTDRFEEIFSEEFKKEDLCEDVEEFAGNDNTGTNDLGYPVIDLNNIENMKQETFSEEDLMDNMIESQEPFPLDHNDDDYNNFENFVEDKKYEIGEFISGDNGYDKYPKAVYDEAEYEMDQVDSVVDEVEGEYNYVPRNNDERYKNDDDVHVTEHEVDKTHQKQLNHNERGGKHDVRGKGLYGDEYDVKDLYMDEKRIKKEKKSRERKLKKKDDKFNETHYYNDYYDDNYKDDSFTKEMVYDHRGHDHKFRDESHRFRDDEEFDLYGYNKHGHKHHHRHGKRDKYHQRQEYVDRRRQEGFRRSNTYPMNGRSSQDGYETYNEYQYHHQYPEDVYHQNKYGHYTRDGYSQHQGFGGYSNYLQTNYSNYANDYTGATFRNYADKMNYIHFSARSSRENTPTDRYNSFNEDSKYGGYGYSFSFGDNNRASYSENYGDKRIVEVNENDSENFKYKDEDKLGKYVKIVNNNEKKIKNFLIHEVSSTNSPKESFDNKFKDQVRENFTSRTEYDENVMDNTENFCVKGNESNLNESIGEIMEEKNVDVNSPTTNVNKHLNTNIGSHLGSHLGSHRDEEEMVENLDEDIITNSQTVKKIIKSGGDIIYEDNMLSIGMIKATKFNTNKYERGHVGDNEVCMDVALTVENTSLFSYSLTFDYSNFDNFPMNVKFMNKNFKGVELVPGDKVVHRFSAQCFGPFVGLPKLVVRASLDVSKQRFFHIYLPIAVSCFFTPSLDLSNLSEKYFNSDKFKHIMKNKVYFNTQKRVHLQQLMNIVTGFGRFRLLQQADNCYYLASTFSAPFYTNSKELYRFTIFAMVEATGSHYHVHVSSDSYRLANSTSMLLKYILQQ